MLITFSKIFHHISFLRLWIGKQGFTGKELRWKIKFLNISESFYHKSSKRLIFDNYIFISVMILCLYIKNSFSDLSVKYIQWMKSNIYFWINRDICRVIPTLIMRRSLPAKTGPSTCNSYSLYECMSIRFVFCILCTFVVVTTLLWVFKDKV